MNEVDISEQELLEKCPAVLHALLKDHTRTDYEKARALCEGRKLDEDFQCNIICGTNNYSDLVESGFDEQDEITEEKITGVNRRLVRPRAVKDLEVQRLRAKDMAEVFTPSWVRNTQNNLVDEAWLGRSGVFNTEFIDKDGVRRWTPTETMIAFDEEPSHTSTKSWKNYVRDVRLEITGGEAPYLVSRYDTVTGQPIGDLNHRIGLLDRKLLYDVGIWGECGSYSNRLDEIYIGPNLFVQAEHAAQVDRVVSRTLLTDFNAHRINILVCSTTMEMGADLGNLEVLTFSSVPPTQANYKQRSGRSGRSNRIRSACVTHCGSDADGLKTLFNPIERIISHPVEVPSGDLASEQVVKRHVNAVLTRALGVFGEEGSGGMLSQKVVDFFTPFGIHRDSGGRLIVFDRANRHPINPYGGMGEDDVATVIDAARELLVRCYCELSERIEEIKYAYNNLTKDNTKFMAKLSMQYVRILGERLIGYWATHRFTLNANTPVNVLSLHLNPSRAYDGRNFSSNPSYSLREAISQYLPGNCVVVDGIVYIVRSV